MIVIDLMQAMKPVPLTQKLQQQCVDWGAYWETSDAQGVRLTQYQAIELLRAALGVEVELKPTQPITQPVQLAPIAAQPYAFAIHFPDIQNIELVHDLEDACEAMTNNRHTVTPLYDTPQIAAQPTVQPAPESAEFKNFHRQLCVRFGYCHDEKDWKRDQVSLIEHIVSTKEAT